MSKSILLIPLLAILISCKQQAPKSASLKQSAVAEQDNHVRLDSFYEIDSTGILVYPLLLIGNENSTYQPGNKQFWNLIFYNAKLGTSHLLADRKMLIVNFHNYSGDNPARTGNSKYLFYRIAVDDTNNDGALSEADAQYLFVSDKAGYNFKQISPSGYNLQNWKYLENANKVVFTAKKDSNGNGKFDDADLIAAFETAPDAGQPAKAMLADTLLQKLNTLLKRDWPKLK